MCMHSYHVCNDYVAVCDVLFFFSSRRRHTRYWRDWSSDVCSSDLGPVSVVPRPSVQDARDLRPHPPHGGAASAYTWTRRHRCGSSPAHGARCSVDPSTDGTEPQPRLARRAAHPCRRRGALASLSGMSEIPSHFRAYVAEQVDAHDGAAVERGVRDWRLDDLPPGEVVIRVEWSSVNFKDGLAVRPDGKVARISPLIPGIDLAGQVLASDDPGIEAGSGVLVHGYDLGVARHGGYSGIQRVPGGWVVPLPGGLSAREAMAIGTAGFTAAMSVAALEERGLTP